MHPRAQLLEQVGFVLAFASAVPAGGAGLAGKFASLKGFDRATALIVVKNATTVTGSAITLEQAQLVDGTGAKAIAFDKAWRCVDAAASALFEEFDVASDTFTALATDNALAVYAIEVTPNMLDIANGFTCFRPKAANATAQTITMLTQLWPGKQMPIEVDALTN